MSESEKGEKIKDAIKRGFIKKSIDDDGVVRYALTPTGLQRWVYELNVKAGRA